MLNKLKKNFARLVIIALSLQAFGAVSPQVAYASVASDYVKPVINSISYGDQIATLVANDTFVMDVSKSDDSTLQTANINVSEYSSLDVSILGGISLISDYSLISGDNVIDVAGELGSSITLSDIQFLTDTLGVITLDINLTDLSNNNNSYFLIITAQDKVDPVVTNLVFAGKKATFDENIFVVDMTGVSDADLVIASIDFGLSEDATVEMVSPIYYDAGSMSAGTHSLDLTTSVGSSVTLADLLDYKEMTIAVTDTAALNPNISFYGVELLFDTVPPELTVVANPEIMTSLSQAINLVFSANEGVKINSDFTFKVDDTAFIPVNTTDVKIDSSDYSVKHSVTIPADFFEASESIIIGYTAVDKAGKETQGTVEILVDTVAPGAVTSLTATVGSNGYVVLTWVNPVNDYVGLQVKRDGVFLTTLPVGATTFTDTSVVRGQTYSYTVTAYDKAGNETMTAPVQITVPSLKVAAAVSDNTSYLNNQTDEGTVTSAENTADTLGEEDVDDGMDEGLPLWAIVLLVILAAIGGYLIYNQKPTQTNVTPTAVKKSAVSPKRKSPSKKPDKK